MLRHITTWVITSHYWIWISFLPFWPHLPLSCCFFLLLLLQCINVWELCKRESVHSCFLLCYIATHELSGSLISDKDLLKTARISTLCSSMLEHSHLLQPLELDSVDSSISFHFKKKQLFIYSLKTIQVFESRSGCIYLLNHPVVFVRLHVS